MALKYCTACRQMGEARRVTPGSFLIEVALWFCFLFPGLIYSLWRVSNKHVVCARCGLTNCLIAPNLAPPEVQRPTLEVDRFGRAMGAAGRAARTLRGGAR